MTWRTRARCLGTDVDFFSDDEDIQREAIAICKRCPVATECLADARACAETDGIRAGKIRGGRLPFRARHCSIDGCANLIQARGWCHKHYTRWLNHGDPLTVRIRPTLDVAKATRLLERTTQAHGLTVGDLTGPRRDMQVMAARREVTRLLRGQGASLHQIGRLLCRDHTTIVHYAKEAA